METRAAPLRPSPRDGGAGTAGKNVGSKFFDGLINAGRVVDRLLQKYGKRQSLEGRATSFFRLGGDIREDITASFRLAH